MSLKLLSLNVQGLRNPVKRRAIFNYARDRADVICLQETHTKPEDEVPWSLEWHGQIVFSHGETNSKGVCILFKNPTDIVCQETDLEGRYVICKIKLQDRMLTICSVYAPNKDDPNFFVGLLDKLVEVGDDIIFLGDFNLVLNTELDRKGKQVNNNKAAAILNQAISDLMFQDIWRVRNEGVKQFSYYRRKPEYSASRIDFAIVSAGMSQFVKSIFYIPGLMTDHRATFMSVSYSEESRGPGYWKFNNSHLLKTEFVETMNNRLEIKLQELEHMQNKREKWELLKFEIANTAQNWSRQYAQEKCLIIVNCMKQLTTWKMTWITL